jgi:hypothetical protein
MANKYWVGGSGSLNTAGHWSTAPGRAIFLGYRPTGTNASLVVTQIYGGSINSSDLLYDSSGTARGTITSGSNGSTGTYTMTATSTALGTAGAPVVLYTMAAGTSTTVAGTGDIAIFDNSSFFGTAATVTVAAAQTLGSIDASGITSGSNGITLTGAFGLTLSAGGGGTSLINLPSSRFTWSHSGILTISAAAGSTVTTNGTPIGSQVSITSATAGIVLLGDLTVYTFTLSGGTLNIGSYQLICTSTFTSTGTTAAVISTTGSGGITVSYNGGGTIVNVTKTTTQLTFPGTKPIFHISNPGTGATTVFSWTGTSWATSTGTMPRLKVSSNTTVTFVNLTLTSATNHNLASLDLSEFLGTFGFTTGNVPTNFYIFGSYIVKGGFTFSYSGTIYLMGSGGTDYVAIASNTFRLDPNSNYVQIGNISCASIQESSVYTTGSFTLNNSGDILNGFNVGYLSSAGKVRLIGNITFNSAIVNLYSPDTTNLTSINIIGGGGTFNVSSGTFGSSIPFIFAETYSGSVYFTNCTILGNITAPTVTIGNFNIVNATISSPITISSNSLTLQNATLIGVLTATVNLGAAAVGLSGTVNIPSSSVITINNADNQVNYYSTVTTFTNKFKINVNIRPEFATGFVGLYSSTGVTNSPDFYISGSGTSTGGLYFGTEANPTTLYCSSLDISNYSNPTRDPVPGSVAVSNFLTQGTSSPRVGLTFFNNQTGTVTINADYLYTITNYNLNTSITLNIISSALRVSNVFYLTELVGLNLNSSTVTLPSNFTLSTTSTATVNAGTSTLILNGGSLSMAGKRLYNVTIASGTSNYITANYINNITNSTQPVGVYFGSNVTFETFNLNGTSNNLVTVGSTSTTQQTLTKSTAWTLANSTNSVDNTGITFGLTGNNSYLNLSHIKGTSTNIVTVTYKNNFFLMF